jgi:DNA-binding NarL/FixJ family response regulator
MPALTPRQRDILQWLMQGLDNQNIARNMGLSVKTIENHLTRLYRQLNVQSRLEAANYGQNHPELIQQPSKLIKRSDSIATIRPATNHQPPATILLVDDNTRFRGQLRRMIGKMHPQANIYEAGNIAHAVSLTQKITPKIVFVDVVLADEDGIACTRQIKQHSPTSRVILISAYPDREFHRRGVQAGATAFVDKKDLDVAALRQIINDILH